LEEFCRNECYETVRVGRVRVFEELAVFNYSVLTFGVQQSSIVNRTPRVRYNIDGQVAMFLTPFTKAVLDKNHSHSAGKEVSVLNRALRFIKMFTRVYHWVISTHTITITSILTLSYHLRHLFCECYKRHPSHLTKFRAIKLYILVYARNEMQKVLVSCSMGAGILSLGEKLGRGVTLITHPHLFPRS
jgi:hypothetical protein